MQKKSITTPDDLRAEIRNLKEQIEHAESERDEALERIAAGENTEHHDLCRMPRIIMEHSPAVLFRRRIGDPPKLIYISDNVRRWGWCADDFMSGKIAYRDMVLPEDHERLEQELIEHDRQDSHDYEQEYRIVTKSGEVRWVRDQTTTVRDADGKAVFRQGLVLDIHNHKKAELALMRSEEKFRRTLETAGEGYMFLDNDLRIQEVNDAYCAMLGYDRDELLGKRPMDLATETYRRFLSAQEEQLMSMEYRRFESKVVAKSGKIVPVLINSNTLRDTAGSVLGNVAFITDLTDQKKALLLAEEVQKSLLPDAPPHAPGLDIAGRSVSCEEIGGDYFDYFDAMGDRTDVLGAVVGDISGHGLDAALLMTTARAFMRMRASKPGTMSDVVSDMNRWLAKDLHGSGRFMTLFSLMIDRESGEVSWIKAGHDPALVYSPVRDDFEELHGRGLPLGILEDSTYEENVSPGFNDSRIIAIGTDGIWEARNSTGEMFGKDRFKGVIRAHAEKSARDVLEAVYNEMDTFTGGLRPRDDVTLVIIKTR